MFKKFPEVELERTLNGLQVLCTHQHQGCRWVGRLGELEIHLNLNPEPERQPEGCHFAPISCIYCFEFYQRFKIQMHQSEECKQRPTRCKFCDHQSTFDDITQTHDCAKFPTLCHQCKHVFLREDFQYHVDNDCPMTPIDCDFKTVGCRIALPRKDMPVHLQDKLTAHVSLQMASHKKLEKENERLKKKVSKQQQEIARLTKEMEEFRISLSVYQSMIQQMQFTLSHFSRLKRTDVEWVSPPFFSHPQGYKMCLRVHANGFLSGKGTHTSVYVLLMKGEFDDHLVWPCRGEVTIQLLGSHAVHTRYVAFDANTPEEYAARVINGERASQGCGNTEFISHTEVAKYIHNDSLIFSISTRFV